MSVHPYPSGVNLWLRSTNRKPGDTYLYGRSLFICERDEEEERNVEQAREHIATIKKRIEELEADNEQATEQIVRYQQEIEELRKKLAQATESSDCPYCDCRIQPDSYTVTISPHPGLR